MSGDGENKGVSSAAFEALFAAAEASVERIKRERTGEEDDPEPKVEVRIPSSTAAVPDEASDKDAASSDPEPVSKDLAVSEPRRPLESSVSKPPRPQNPLAGSSATTAKSAGTSKMDSAIKQSLIKAKNELNELLIAEKRTVAGMVKEAERQKQRITVLKNNLDTARERAHRDRDTAVDSAREKLLKEFLPVIDNLERALTVNIDTAGTEIGPQVEALRSGVENVLGLFRSSLKKFNVEGTTAVGQIFDPNQHEAIRRVEDPSVPNNQIVEEYHKGYHINGRLLRPALVVVASGGPAAAASTDANG